MVFWRNLKVYPCVQNIIRSHPDPVQSSSHIHVHLNSFSNLASISWPKILCAPVCVYTYMYVYILVYVSRPVHLVLLGLVTLTM
jgi:hypothetical protein